MALSGSDPVPTRPQFENALRLALDSIRAHKLRSFLTLLGIIIGVASVILVGAAIDGVGVYAEQSTSKAFGAESFIVARVAGAAMSRREYFDRLKHNKPISADDLRFVKSVAGQDVLYSPFRNHTSDIKRENQICEAANVTGVSADIVTIRDVGVSDGRFFTEQEERARNQKLLAAADLKNAGAGGIETGLLDQASHDLLVGARGVIPAKRTKAAAASRRSMRRAWLCGRGSISVPATPTNLTPSRPTPSAASSTGCSAWWRPSSCPSPVFRWWLAASSS